MVIAHVRPTVWWSIEIHYNGEDLMVHRYLDRPWIVLLLATRRLVLDMLPSLFCVCRRRCPFFFWRWRRCPFGYIKITKASHTHMRLSCLPLCHHQFLFQIEEWANRCIQCINQPDFDSNYYEYCLQLLLSNPPNSTSQIVRSNFG